MIKTLICHTMNAFGHHNKAAPEVTGGAESDSGPVDYGKGLLRSWPRAIVHVDGDAFFASCEQAMRPELRGKPVITGKERGIVSAASYEAKAFGIQRGVPLWEVKKLCPQAIIVSSDYESYNLFSKRMFDIMRQFTPSVEESSIDEGFADITGFQRAYHASYLEIARQMKTRIESELRITVSLGMSLSKVLAKIGSKHQKPSGFTPVSGKQIYPFLEKTPIQEVWGIGPRTGAYCQALGIHTAARFAQKDETFIKQHFSKPHYEIWQELNGHSVYPLNTEDKTTYASISKTRTFTPPSSQRAFVLAHLLKNMENACIKARRHGLVARGVVVDLKTQEFRHAAMEARLSRATAFPTDMATVVRPLFQKLFKPRTFYRATGIVLLGLQPNDNLQLSLFEAPIKIEKLERIYQAVDELSARMGKHTVFMASGYHPEAIPYDPGDDARGGFARHI